MLTDTRSSDIFCQPGLLSKGRKHEGTPAKIEDFILEQEFDLDEFMV